MASALNKVSPKLRSRPAVRSLAKSLDRARARNRRLKEEAQNPGTVRTTLAVQAGAATTGIALATVGPTLMGMPIPGVLGVAGITLGAFTGNADLINGANGALAPMTAAWIASMFAGDDSDADSGADE